MTDLEALVVAGCVFAEYSVPVPAIDTASLQDDLVDTFEIRDGDERGVDRAAEGPASTDR